MSNLYSMVGEVSSAAPGTADITLNGVISGYLAFDDAQGLGTGSISNRPVIVRIEDSTNSASWEITRGLYTKSGATKTLTRPATPRKSSNAGSKVNFANVVNVYIAADGEAFGPETGVRSFVLTAGSSTAYTATFTPPIPELLDGMVVELEWHTTSGAAPTLNVDGKGAKQIRGMRVGTMQNVPSGSLLSGTTTRLRYRLSTTTWDIVGDHTASGSYTPTLTNVTNMAANTSYAAQWMYVNGIVNVSGRLDADPTAAGATNTRLEISIPIASNFAALEDCCGVIAANSAGAVTESGNIHADATDDRAAAEWLSATTANHGMTYTFQYRVI